MAPLKTPFLELMGRSRRTENRSLLGVNEDSSTKATPPVAKKMVFLEVPYGKITRTRIKQWRRHWKRSGWENLDLLAI